MVFYLPTYLPTHSSSFESSRLGLSSYLPAFLWLTVAHSKALFSLYHPTYLPTYQPHQQDGKPQAIKAMVADDEEIDDMIKDNDEFGWSVLSLGDVDGDGIVDLAVAAETSPGRRKHACLHMIYLAPQDDPPAAAVAAAEKKKK